MVYDNEVFQGQALAAQQARLVSDVMREQQQKAQLALASQSSSPSDVSNPTVQSQTQSIQSPTGQLNAINREISKTQDAIKHATNDSSRDYLVQHLQDLQQMRSDLIKTGNAYTTQLIQIQEERKAATEQIIPNLLSSSSPSSKVSVTSNSATKSSIVSGIVSNNLPQIDFSSQVQQGMAKSQQQEIINSSIQQKILTNQNRSQNTISPSNQIHVDMYLPKPLSTVRPRSEVFNKPNLSEAISNAGEELKTRGIVDNSINAGIYSTVGSGILLAKGAVEGVAGSILSFTPISIKGQLQVPIIEPFANTIQSASSGELQDYALEHPEEFTGNIIGSASSGKLLDLGISSGIIPKPVISGTIIPTEGGGVSIKSLALEYGKGKSFIVGSIKPAESFSFNVFSKAPDINAELNTLVSGKEIRIAGATETKIVKENLKNNPNVADVNRAQNYVDVGQNILRKTENVKSRFVSEFPKTTERLNEVGTRIALDVTKDNQGYVSGSFSRSGQLAPSYNILEDKPSSRYYGTEVEKSSQGKVFDTTNKINQKYVLSKSPRDIDIHLPGKTPIEIQAIAEDTLNRFKAAGIDAQLKGEGGQVQNAILVRQPNGGYEKAIEFLGEGTLPKEEITPDYVLGFKKEGAKTEIGGVESTSLNEELRGVMQGTARLKNTENGLDIFPPEKRLKDIGSVSVSARTLQQSKTLDLNNLQFDINKFEGLYPEKLVREQVIKVNSESTTQIVLADFRDNSLITPSTSSGITGMAVASISPQVLSFPIVQSSYNSYLISPIGSSESPSSSYTSLPSSSQSKRKMTELISPIPSNQSPGSIFNFSPFSSLISSPSDLPSPSPSPSDITSPSSSSPSSFSPSSSPSMFPPQSPSSSSFSFGDYSSTSAPSTTTPYINSRGEGNNRKKRLFEAITRRHGKPFAIPGTQSEVASNALLRGESFVGRTLARSLGVIDKSSGEFINLGTPQGYHPSKRGGPFMIQSNALSSFGETSEIQSAKKKKLGGVFG